MDEALIHINIDDSDRKALEAFVVDNRDLERLEDLLSQFNIFEAIGAVWQELRHSDFLAFLLDPQENHGLGDVFLKRLLQKIWVDVDRSTIPISPIDLDMWSLDEIFVRREWQNIDILLEDETHQLAIIIENKIGTGEHSDQLERYYQQVCHLHSNWKNIFGLYLTPDGEQPSHRAYLPINYELVCTLLENLANSRASTLGTDVLTAIKHYTQMLRRHIVENTEIDELCLRIYQKHRRALDLIYERRPDRQETIRMFLFKLIEAEPELILDDSGKTSIRFSVKDWEVPILKQGKGWTPSGRILLFQFTNSIDKLKLALYIGPGPENTRQELFEFAHKQPPLKPQKTLSKLWSVIYSRSFATSRPYEEMSEDEIEAEISDHWKNFVQKDLSKIVAAISHYAHSSSPT